MAQWLPEPEIDRERPCGQKFCQADVCALRCAASDAHDASLRECSCDLLTCDGQAARVGSWTIGWLSSICDLPNPE
jgi:hypothetical protein